MAFKFSLTQIQLGIDVCRKANVMLLDVGKTCDTINHLS